MKKMEDFKHTFYLLELENLLCVKKISNSKDYNELIYHYISLQNHNIKSILNCFCPVLRLLLALVSLVYVTICFVVSLFKCINNTPPNIVKGRTYYLFFHRLFLQRLISSGLYDQSEFFINGGVIKDLSKYDLKDKIVVDYKKYITANDVCYALLMSYQTIWKYYYDYACYFPIYKVWEYYEAYRAMYKLLEGCEIVYCNQYDRWGMLFDRLSVVKTTQVQHGINYTKVFAKLMHVDVFYAINKKAGEELLDSTIGSHPVVKYMKPTIVLFDIPKNSKFSVLIVSHICVIEHEKKIFELIKNIGGFNVYVKKHPWLQDDTPYKGLQEKYGFIYITDYRFPRVDCVISYISTLAYEYEMFSIPVYMYNQDLKLDMNDLQLFLECVKDNVQ